MEMAMRGPNAPTKMRADPDLRPKAALLEAAQQ
jgi:hypothetical protein